MMMHMMKNPNELNQEFNKFFFFFKLRIQPLKSLSHHLQLLFTHALLIIIFFFIHDPGSGCSMATLPNAGMATLVVPGLRFNVAKRVCPTVWDRTQVCSENGPQPRIKSMQLYANYSNDLK